MQGQETPYKSAFFILVLIIILGIVGVSAYLFGKGEFFVFEKIAQETPSPQALQLTPTPFTVSTPTVSDEIAIKQAIYKKLGKTEGEILVTISKNTGSHATGGIKDVGSEVGGEYFLAAKTASGWVIVHDGQASPTCSQIAPYNFPKDMVPECLNASGYPVKR